MKFKKRNVSLPVRRLGGLVGFLIAITLGLQPPAQVEAKTESPWKPNERVPGYADETYTPFIVADQDHYVHAFATQWTGSGVRNGVVYRKWSLEAGWTTPVDILLSPIESDAVIQGVYLDPTGMFHLLFFSGERTRKYIYYSQARVEEAASARAWSTPTIIGTQAIDPRKFGGDLLRQYRRRGGVLRVLHRFGFNLVQSGNGIPDPRLAQCSL
jgi:hypothetical protein